MKKRLLNKQQRDNYRTATQNFNRCSLIEKMPPCSWATGSTILAAIRLCRNRGAGKVVVAAPVASPRTMLEVREEADEAVILETPALFYAVGQFYESFGNLEDQETRAFLEKWERETKGHKIEES